jgi:hypothetical protein
MVQADFLLNANREDIDQSCERNLALRDELYVAFLDAIDLFNSNRMRYHWPHYLPSRPVDRFFQPMANKIHEELSSRAVLESWARTLEKPNALSYIPLKFRDNTGTPFTLTEANTAHYLAPRYPAWEINYLFRLGVQHLSSAGFLQGLEQLGLSLSGKSPDWHSQLAKALLSLLSDDLCGSIIKQLDLIPLRTGEWVCGERHPIYFPRGVHGLNIPGGVTISVVDHEAADDCWRKTFFQQLGVKDCDTFEVCRAIVNGYCGQPLRPLVVSRQELVAQATYLYERKWSTEAVIRFWFATSNGDYAQGSKAYIREPMDRGSPEERVYNILQTKFPFLHDNYTAAVSKADHTWRSWLMTSFGVSTLPRLIEALPSNPSDKIELSEEIELLFAKGEASDVLWFLRKHWHDYSRFLEFELFPKISSQSKTRFYEVLGSLTIKNRNAVLAPLQGSFLPSLDYEMEALPNICILDIQNPKDRGWAFLENFGVTVEANVRYYVRCLELLRNTEPDKRLILRAYEQIQAQSDENQDLLR